MLFFNTKAWSVQGKHCHVTGGSQGTGLELSKLLVKAGAHVSIVARDQGRLQAAAKELESLRSSPDQVVSWHSYSLSQHQSSLAALDEACNSHGGRCPDAMFLCAGSAAPRFLVDEDENTFKTGMEQAYWVQAWTAMAGAKRMIQDNVNGKIVFVSSFLGYMGFIGYSSYAPGKHALRGLADTLRSELLLYDISVHIYFPGTIYTNGLLEENKTKPAIALEIEKGDPGITPEQAATAIFKGVKKNRFHITGDSLGHIFRSSTRGATPGNNVIVDEFYRFIGLFGLPIWRRGVDAKIRKHRQEHQEYLSHQDISKG